MRQIPPYFALDPVESLGFAHYSFYLSVVFGSFDVQISFFLADSSFRVRDSIIPPIFLLDLLFEFVLVFWNSLYQLCFMV